MSQSPARFERRHNRATELKQLEVEGEVFLFTPSLGTKAMEHIARTSDGDIGGLFDALRALVVDGPDDEPGDAYRRLIDLDFDMQDELGDLLGTITGLYGESPGESPALSSPESDDEANSSPTSNGSTGSTSTSSGKKRKATVSG